MLVTSWSSGQTGTSVWTPVPWTSSSYPVLVSLSLMFWAVDFTNLVLTLYLYQVYIGDNVRSVRSTTTCATSVVPCLNLLRVSKITCDTSTTAYLTNPLSLLRSLIKIIRSSSVPCSILLLPIVSYSYNCWYFINRSRLLLEKPHWYQNTDHRILGWAGLYIPPWEPFLLTMLLFTWFYHLGIILLWPFSLHKVYILIPANHNAPKSRRYKIWARKIRTNSIKVW